MPTYQYRCEKCGKAFERTETISEHDTAKPQCPKCGSKKVSERDTKLAEKFGLSRGTVWKARVGITWKHVKPLQGRSPAAERGVPGINHQPEGSPALPRL
jgi:putative FmdB family regulatory protein